MGLLEKRAIKDFQEGKYLSLVKEIQSLAGYEIEFEVNWDSLIEVGIGTDYYENNFTKVYFDPIILALKEITADELGKEALKTTLKKIVITNENGIFSAPKCYSFQDGVLTIDHQANSNVDYAGERGTKLGEFLMQQM